MEVPLPASSAPRRGIDGPEAPASLIKPEPESRRRSERPYVLDNSTGQLVDRAKWQRLWYPKYKDGKRVEDGHHWLRVYFDEYGILRAGVRSVNSSEAQRARGSMGQITPGFNDELLTGIAKWLSDLDMKLVFPDPNHPVIDDDKSEEEGFVPPPPEPKKKIGRPTNAEIAARKLREQQQQQEQAPKVGE